MGNEQSSPIDESVPPTRLEARTLQSLAKYINSERCRKIVVMVGAGISTSAGIPDFRSPETGLYANLARLNLPYAEAVFDISYFRQNPDPFYTLASELYPGKFRPTITHSFIRLLYEKGLLLKCFTQNIDCLEREAGVPGDLMIEAHGSFATQRCIECKTPYSKMLMMRAIDGKYVPHCPTCNGLVKPDIVFFGEALPEHFFNNRTLPQEADLAIVMGTSLQVAPFSTLPEYCEDGTPRLLINLERVGSLGCWTDDVLELGDCDTGVRRLAEALGWLEELETLWAETARESYTTEAKPAPVAPKTEPKTKDDQLTSDVDRLTKDIERTLKLSQGHKDWLEKHLDKKSEAIETRANLMAVEPQHSALKEGESAGTREAVENGQIGGDNPKGPQAVPHTASGEQASGRSPDSGREAGGGLGHVFPHIKEKPSL